MEEIFKPIDGKEGYHISNLGRVKSTKRKEPIMLATYKNKQGFCEAHIWNHSKLGFLNVAREVLASFVGYPAEPWLCVAKHKNGDLMDCRLENLEWVICQTDETYDPRRSKRKGVLKPSHTRDKMTEAKLHQGDDTIRKAVMTRQRTIARKKMFQEPEEDVIDDKRKDELRDLYLIQTRLNNGK